MSMKDLIACRFGIVAVPSVLGACRSTPLRWALGVPRLIQMDLGSKNGYSSTWLQVDTYRSRYLYLQVPSPPKLWD